MTALRKQSIAAVAFVLIAVAVTSGCNETTTGSAAKMSPTEVSGETVQSGSKSSSEEPPSRAASDSAARKNDAARQDDSAGTEFQKQLDLLMSGRSQQLRLERSPITLDELHKLVAQTQLLDLILDAGGIDDEHMPLVAEMSQLEHLRIRHSRLSDAGLHSLCEGTLHRLRILNLPQAKFSPKGVAALGQLPSLTNLRLGGAWIDDDAATEISKLSNLKSLHLIGPKITGLGLRQLAESPKLASFYLDDCTIPDADWEFFFTAKPNIHVHVDQQHHDRDPDKHQH